MTRAEAAAAAEEEEGQEVNEVREGRREGEQVVLDG